MSFFRGIAHSLSAQSIWQEGQCTAVLLSLRLPFACLPHASLPPARSAQPHLEQRLVLQVHLLVEALVQFLDGLEDGLVVGT